MTIFSKTTMADICFFNTGLSFCFCKAWIYCYQNTFFIILANPLGLVFTIHHYFT